MQAEAGEAKAQPGCIIPSRTGELGVEDGDASAITNGTATQMFRRITVEQSQRFLMIFVISVFLLTWTCTGAHFMADTNVYAGAILTHEHGLPPDDYHRISSNPFWDLGHLLWRPIGWLSFVISKPLTHLLSHGSEPAQVILSLMGLDFLAALSCVVFVFLLARQVTGDPWTATLAAIALIFSDAFLNYSHTGNAYPVGLACLLGGMYLSTSGASSLRLSPYNEFPPVMS